METNMACPCGAPLVQEGDKLVCAHHCGYEKLIIKPVPSQAELLKELEAIKGNGVYLPANTWESDILSIVYRLRKTDIGKPPKSGMLYFVPDKPQD